MFTIQELQVLFQALNAMDIKGSDAIYMANLQTKVNDTVEKIKKEAEEKSLKAKEIVKKEEEKSNKK